MVLLFLSTSRRDQMRMNRLLQALRLLAHIKVQDILLLDMSRDLEESLVDVEALKQDVKRYPKDSKIHVAVRIQNFAEQEEEYISLENRHTLSRKVGDISGVQGVRGEDC
jgi:hypothetical protein